VIGRNLPGVHDPLALGLVHMGVEKYDILQLDTPSTQP
jgi:hypothetical protein